MFMLHGRLAAKPGKRDELLGILAAAGEHAQRLPGCRLPILDTAGFTRQQLDARSGVPD